MQKSCKSEDTACGNVFGDGPCAKAISCLGENQDINRDCAVEKCLSANPNGQANNAFVCMADKCGAECDVTPGFICPDAAASFADAWTPAGEAKGACSTCLETSCTKENKACGDVGKNGDGACVKLVACLANDTAEPDLNCSIEKCSASALTTEGNNVLTCMGNKCAADCKVKQGFPCAN